ncbi:MAG: DUF1080 domain-containing protein [Sediminibacterium sp.]|nr:MAG: DUF1080 domain-containing protein [Sediminibacterium sp.]
MQTLLYSCLLSATLLVGSPDKNVKKETAKSKGWISLFDGKTTKGWHTFGKTTVGEYWKVQDGALFLDAAAKKEMKAQGDGDILSDAIFGDFDLKVDWKISPKGNSGIIFWVQDDAVKYEHAFHTGPEVQVLDNDGHSDGKIIKHRAGNLYDLVEGKEGAVKPVGEWNTCEIICNKGKMEIILNGTSVVTTNYGDDNWRDMISKSKFKKMPDFGRIFSGNICLQDHGNDVWFKNILIKKL